MERLTNGIDYCKMHCDFGNSNECFFSDKDKCYERSIYNRLREYENLEEQGLLLRLPRNVGDTVYVLAECKNVNLVLDGTMYDSSGGYGTATGYYCTYEDRCPHIDYSDDCDKCRDKTAVFEDTVNYIGYDETGITLQCENTNVCGYIGEYIFLTREEAEQKLKEMGSD